jgi:hypothetical protein
MRHKTFNLYYIFRRGALILIVALVFSTIAKSQETNSPEKFYIGAKLATNPYDLKKTFNSFLELGFNSIWWGAYPDTKPYLEKFQGILMVENGRSRKDYIHHYATGYYSRWEAEQNQVINRVGLKHKYGKAVILNDVQCWSSIGLKSPKDSLIYGPHYRQEKRYKRWLYDEPGWSRYVVDYNVRFRMALRYVPGSVSQDEDVCVIKVIYRYIRQYPGGWDPPEDIVLMKKTLKVQDFSGGSNFDYIPFDEAYQYPEKFNIPELERPSPTKYTYNDTEAGLGIQFCIDWLRKNDLCTLYVDHIDVYDDDGWNDVIDDPLETSKKIKKYALSLSEKYPSIKYWFAHDEPYSIDAFLPYHIVDSIVTNTTGIPLITEFYPYWTHDGKINGEDFLQLWYDIAKPKKLMIDYYPFSPDYPFRLKDTEELKFRFQKCHTLQPGFWYSGQAFGSQVNNEWKIWRSPDTTEFKASVMLGLAHGMKGLFLFSYDSFNEMVGIVINNQKYFSKSNLWYVLKNNLVPRLKGKLGKTLMTLNYTGNYLQYYKIGKKQDDGSLRQMSDDFLTLRFGSSQPEEKNWHCGLFRRQNRPDDKYFFLANLYTIADSRSIEIKLTETGREYKNYRFRNIEGKFDTTFAVEFTKQIYHPKGEGYLYQVAPVIKYGGRLLFSEETKNGIELNDDMIIENGAVLTINGSYYAKANITVKNGRVAYKNKGKIHFASNKRLFTK